ncbi:hypothetical protein O6H91_08G099300 [Diphasiastrum complanatum]|uniref:Uncharacterized protein n=1 Tax=Diphasiastrum complanatum TaxID=34168 RepID=A0ACC2D0H9_DIPCM|nr:hypothetical protein O6H91_08G099300 [Diphasiastrum complanatum]
MRFEPPLGNQEALAPFQQDLIYRLEHQYVQHGIASRTTKGGASQNIALVSTQTSDQLCSQHGNENFLAFPDYEAVTELRHPCLVSTKRKKDDSNNVSNVEGSPTAAVLTFQNTISDIQTAGFLAQYHRSNYITQKVH